LLLASFYYFEIAFAPNLRTTPPLSSPNFEPTTLQYPNYGEISNQPLDITNPAIPVPFFQKNHPGPLVLFAIYIFVPVFRTQIKKTLFFLDFHKKKTQFSHFL